MVKSSTPYSATFTGCSFMFYEFNSVLPLMRSENAEALLKQECKERTNLQLNDEVSAKRIMSEFKRRYNAVPSLFWDWYESLEETAKRVALLYVIMKTYRLVLDFHMEVAVRKWNSVDRTLVHDDLQMILLDISSSEPLVDSWSDNTKKKLRSSYLTMLRQAGALDPKTSELIPLKLDANDYRYYIEYGDSWFLDACFLTQFEKTNIINAIN